MNGISLRALNCSDVAKDIEIKFLVQSDRRQSTYIILYETCTNSSYISITWKSYELKRNWKQRIVIFAM